MSSSIAEETAPVVFTAAVVTVSDSCARGERVDLSGPAVAEVLKKSGFRVVAAQIVQDDSMQIQNALVHLALEARFIVTAGGTGIAPRDVTPEATEAICDRLIDGVGERMRLEGAKKTSFAALSRGVCGVREKISDFKSAGQSQRCRRIFGSCAGPDSSCAKFVGWEDGTFLVGAGPGISAGPIDEARG